MEPIGIGWNTQIIPTGSSRNCNLLEPIGIGWNTQIIPTGSSRNCNLLEPIGIGWNTQIIPTGSDRFQFFGISPPKCQIWCYNGEHVFIYVLQSIYNVYKQHMITYIEIWKVWVFTGKESCGTFLGFYFQEPSETIGNRWNRWNRWNLLEPCVGTCWNRGGIL